MVLNWLSLLFLQKALSVKRGENMCVFYGIKMIKILEKDEFYEKTTKTRENNRK